jgi:hypothetical protein
MSMVEQQVWLSRRPRSGDKALEVDDPYELTSVRYPVAPGVDADRETALTLIEEFAMQGWRPGAISNLFADPHAGSAYAIFARRGDHFLHELLDEVFGSVGEDG